MNGTWAGDGNTCIPYMPLLAGEGDKTQRKT